MMRRLPIVWMVAGLGCGSAAAPQPVTTGSPPRRTMSPGPDKQEFQLYPLGAALYPTTSDGFTPGAKLPVYDLVCERDLTRKPVVERCVATTERFASPYMPRLSRCLVFDRKQPAKAVLDTAHAMLDEMLKRSTMMISPIQLPMPPNGITIVRARTIENVAEVRGSGCENGPDPSIGTCDPVVTPTGRMLRNVAERVLIAKPTGMFEIDAFQPTYLNFWWAQPGHETRVTNGNVTIPTFHPDPRLPHKPTNNGLFPEARDAIAAIDGFGGATTPSLDGTLLANRAVAFVTLGDQAGVRESVAALEAWVAANPSVDTQRGGVPTTLAALRKILKPGWTFVDPCGP